MAPHPTATSRTLDATGGVDVQTSQPRDPRRIWKELQDAQRIYVFGDDGRTPAGEIRMLPDGAAVYRDERGFWLLSPGEVEDLAQTHKVGL